MRQYIGNTNFVIPPRLKPRSQYTLSVAWAAAEGANYSQQIRFTTSPQALNLNRLLEQESSPPPSTIAFTWHWPTLRVTGNGYASGRPVKVRIWACVDLMHCPAPHQRFLVSKATVLRPNATAISIHGSRPRGTLLLTLTTRAYTDGTTKVQGTTRGEGFVLR